MKLKNIASLLLAGVMAASMLAGCQTTSNEQPTQPEEPTTPSTGYSSMLEDKMSVQVTNKTVFQDDADLNAALDYAVGNVGHDDITADFVHGALSGGAVRFIGNNKDANDPLRMVVSTMRDKLDVKAEWGTKSDAAGATDTLDNIRPSDVDPDAYNYYTKKNVNTLLVYVVDDGVKIPNALDQIKNQLQSTWEDDLYDDFKLSNDNNSGRDYHYVCSVAVSNRNFESGHGIGLNFIAVEVTRVDGNK